MKSFPENFSFEYSSSHLHNSLSQKINRDLGKIREEIYDEYTNALENFRSYFVISLNHSHMIKNAILEELIDKFPEIYPVISAPDDMDITSYKLMILDKFPQISAVSSFFDREITYFCHKIKKKNVNLYSRCDKYLIILTNLYTYDLK
jgi:hypothetical protein